MRRCLKLTFYVAYFFLKRYLILPQAIGAAILDAAMNFGIACAMYHTTPKEIRLWNLTSTSSPTVTPCSHLIFV